MRLARHSLKTRITLAVLTIFVVGSWALSLYTSRMLRDDLRDLLGAQQFSTVSVFATETHHELRDRLQWLEAVAEKITPAMLGNPPALQEFLDQRLTLPSLFNGGGIIYAADGTAVADSLPATGRIGVNYMDIDTVATALKEGKSTIGKPVTGKKLEVAVFGMTAPIRDAQGKVIGAFAGVTNLAMPSFLDNIQQGRPGNTGGYLLVDPKSRLIIAASDKARAMEVLPAPGVNPTLDRFVEGFEGTDVFVNPRGVEVLASAKGIPASGWYVASILPTADAFAPVHAMQQRMLIATLLLTLLAGGLTWLMLRRQLAPMLETERVLARLAASSGPAQSLPITREDEIGEMIGAFNHLLDSLAQRDVALHQRDEILRNILETSLDGFWRVDAQGRLLDVNPTYCQQSGYGREELLGMAVADLEASEGAAEIAAHLRCIIETGHNQFESRHRRKDGSVWDVEVSATYRDESGLLCAFFRDITERKNADAALVASEARWKFAIEGAGDGLWDWHIQTGKAYYSTRYKTMLGFAEDEIGDSADEWSKRIHPEDAPGVFAAMQPYMDGKPGSATVEFRMLCKDGRWMWTLGRGMVVERDAQGKPLRMIGTNSDFTARKQAEQYEQFRTRTLELLTANEPLPALLEAIVRGVEQLNPSMLCSILLLDGEGRHLGKGVAPSLPDSYNAALNGIEIGIGVGSCGTAAVTGERVIVADIATHPYWTPYKDLAASAGLGACWSQPILGTNGRVLGTFAIYHRAPHTPASSDIGLIEEAAKLASIAIERKAVQEKLELAAGVFSHALEGIVITTPDAIIIDVNEAFTRITGYTRDEALGKNPSFLSAGRQGPEFFSAMWRSLTNDGYWYGEIWNRRKSGEVFIEMQTVSAVRDSLGRVRHYIALFSDITDRKAHESQLEHMAHFDLLTNLPNRVLLADRLHQAMAQAQRRQQQLVVAYLDLDGFKTINDQHDHETGDQVLITLAQRMKEALREGDTIARIGGDEFVAVLTDLEDTSASVPLLNRLLAAAALPVQVGELSLQISASLGVTFYPQAHDIEADQLLRQADQAMYQAKMAGKNRYCVFDAAQDSSLRDHHESLERIRVALERREFVLHYQPKVSMRSGKVMGAEALIRWQHPEKGLLAPATFLPVIEDHPLAVEVGEWVIDTAMQQMEAWHAAGLDLPVSVNIGARQLQQSDFVARLQAILAKHPQVHPGCIELEVLETSALNDMVQVSQVIDDCARIGVKFALDDFGTGYSSLTYLKHLRVALLKIDQSFVRDMLDDPDDLAILQGIIGLAAAFKREVIAEGVETVAHGTVLLQLGCELAQGYGIARPMPPDQLPAWAATWRPDAAWSEATKSAEVSGSAGR